MCSLIGHMCTDFFIVTMTGIILLNKVEINKVHVLFANIMGKTKTKTKTSV